MAPDTPANTATAHMHPAEQLTIRPGTDTNLARVTCTTHVETMKEIVKGESIARPLHKVLTGHRATDMATGRCMKEGRRWGPKRLECIRKTRGWDKPRGSKSRASRGCKGVLQKEARILGKKNEGKHEYNDGKHVYCLKIFESKRKLKKEQAEVTALSRSSPLAEI